MTRAERANYRAVKNWLVKYQALVAATNLEKLKGLLESYYHLCELAEWEAATQLLLLRVNIVNRKLQGALVEPFHLQLGRWGYYTVQRQLYERLLGQSTPETEVVCLNGLGMVCQSMGDPAGAVEWHSQHLDLARDLANLEAEQNVLCNLGNV